MYINLKMFKYFIKFITKTFFLFFLLNLNVFAEIVKKIEITGNERISDETIKMFSDIKLGEDLNKKNINAILKKLYDTNFFEDISVILNQNKLRIVVKEYPIIQSIKFDGIKSNSLRDDITRNLKLKNRSSFNENILNKDKNIILSELKNKGYYFSKIDVELIDLENNKIDLVYNINLGEKAKIKKIIFLGNKIFKDGKLKNLIISEEYKFWKFISGKKYLNENIINLDKRLLKNFYLNKGYYDVEVNSSFAKMINENEFELVFNIDAKDKFYFNDLNLDLPIDYEKSNFENLEEIFNKLKNEPYSINSVKSIIDEIDKITLSEQYESIKVDVEEKIVKNQINLIFKIQETEKFFVEKINIFGNNITRENVIRNQFYIDEGDPYNEILTKKSINEIKSLNFLRMLITTLLVERTIILKL